MFCDANVMDVIHDNSALESHTTSLRVSLELSIAHLVKKDSEVIKLFCLIGLLPSGANKEEINIIMGGNNWIKHKNTLMDSSLLLHKNNSKEADIYYMLPFMAERA